jgi:hypothetical protein
VGVLGGVEGEQGFVGGEEATGEVVGAAVWGGVGDEDGVGEGGDEGVAGSGEVAGDAALVGWEGREEKQATIGEWLFPGGWEAHAVDGAGGADDERLGAAEEEVEGFALHRGVEAADDDAAGVAEGADEVVGLEDEAAGACGGAEEGEVA